MIDLSLADLLTIVAVLLGPGVALLWRFMAGPSAPYRRGVEELMAAQRAAEVLSSLGEVHEARLGVRQAELRILGRVEFNRQIRRKPRPLYLALAAWGFLAGGLIVDVGRGPVVGWLGLGLLTVSLLVGTLAGLAIRHLIVATRPATVRAYRELCRSRIRSRIIERALFGGAVRPQALPKRA